MDKEYFDEATLQSMEVGDSISNDYTIDHVLYETQAICVLNGWIYIFRIYSGDSAPVQMNSTFVPRFP